MWTLLLLKAFTVEAGRKCYGLSLEGGGAHGAYEAGVLQGLKGLVDPRDIQWDFIHGISAGAINTGLASQFPIGKEFDMIDFMVDFWATAKGNDDFFVLWNWNVFDWLFFKYGLVDNNPLHERLTAKMTKTPQRPVSIGTTDMNDASFHIFDGTLPLPNFIEAVVCSTCYPPAFPHQNVLGGVFADGCVLHNLDIAPLVEKCLTKVRDESDIVIDLILDEYAGTYEADLTDLDTGKVFEIVKDVKGMDAYTHFVDNAERAYPEVTFRYVITPSAQLNSAADGRPSSLDASITLGQQDAQTYVNQMQQNGPNWKHLREQRANSKKFVVAE